MSFRHDQFVRLQCLSNAMYNGLLGRILSFSSGVCHNGRYCVELIGDIAPQLLRTLQVKPENIVHVCRHCLKGGEKLLFCAKCRHSRYCDQNCQKLDWARHKEECVSCGQSRDMTNNPLIIPIESGDLNRVQKLAQDDGIDVNMTSKTTNATALHVAAVRGHTSIVQYLLCKGADKDKADNRGITPLYVSSQEVHLAVVRCLLEHGADKEKVDNVGKSPLFVAAINVQMAVVKFLLAQGADVNTATFDGATPLLITASHGKLAVVHCLLEHGADKDKADKRGFFPLLVAALNGHLGVCNLSTARIRSSSRQKSS